MESEFNNSDIDIAGLSAENLYAGMNQMKTGMAIYDSKLNLIFANKTIRGYLPTLYANLDAGLPMKACIMAQSRAINPHMDSVQIERSATHIYNTIKKSGTLQVNTPSGLKLNSSYDKTSQGIYIITTTDVTERVKNENQLIVERINANAANSAKTEFLANMSHEIRTPLSGVSMAASLLQRQLGLMNNPELSGLAAILVDSSNHLSAIINDVLDLSKIEAGQVDIDLSENSLADMLHSLKKAQENIANEKGLHLKLVIDPNLPKLLNYDSVRVRQCITNLMSNALKFTAEGSVTLAALYDPQTSIVTIHVADTGIGIASDEKRQVFDHYAQAKSQALKPHMGTGLGLAISRRLARLMGGDVKLTSKLGDGSIFSLTFPSETTSSLVNNLPNAA